MDTVAAYQSMARSAEGSVLARLQETARRRVSAAAFSWLEVAVLDLVLRGAEYQARHLPPGLREFAQLDVRTDSISRFARARVSRLLDRPELTADAEQASLVLRPRLIASGEVNAALFFGRHEMIAQLIDRGRLRPDWVTREWRTSRDERVRNSHVAMHGQVRLWGVPFSSPFSGAMLMHPHDSLAPASEVVNCRCSEIIRVTFP